MSELKYPPYLQWEVTSECNQNCIHCYNYWRKDSEVQHITVNNHIEIAKKIVDLHPVSVVVTGGEPLLVFNSIKDSLKLLRKNGIHISINTNAVLVTDEIANFLSDLDISAFVSLPCSDPTICDDITNFPNSLKKISIGIRTLLNHNVRVTANMVVSKRNLNYIYSTAKYAKETLNLSRFFASRVSKPINSDKTFYQELLSKDETALIYTELIKISEELKLETDTSTPVPACFFTNSTLFDTFAYHKSCTAGKVTYAIDSLGNIKACPRDVTIYGNILTDNFAEVWDSMKEWRDDTFLPKECKSCVVKKQCTGGCRLDAYPLTGKKDSLDPISIPENLPIKFKKKEQKTFYPDNQIFTIPKNLQVIKESCGWRVSVGSKFIVATDELKDFLVNRTKFCINDFIHIFDVNYDLGNNVVNMLVLNNIIFIYK